MFVFSTKQSLFTQLRYARKTLLIIFVVIERNKSKMFGVNMRHMTEKKSPTSRRRSSPSLGRKTFVYFTDEERSLIDEAAKIERRSVSSFVANAALAAAEMIARRTHAKSSHSL